MIMVRGKKDIFHLIYYNLYIFWCFVWVLFVFGVFFFTQFVFRKKAYLLWLSMTEEFISM